MKISVTLPAVCQNPKTYSAGFIQHRDLPCLLVIFLTEQEIKKTQILLKNWACIGESAEAETAVCRTGGYEFNALLVNSLYKFPTNTRLKPFFKIHCIGFK